MCGSSARDGWGLVPAVSTKKAAKCVSSLVFFCIIHRSVPAERVRRVSSGRPLGTNSYGGNQCSCHKYTKQMNTAWQNVECSTPLWQFQCYVVQMNAKPWDKHEQKKMNICCYPFLAGRYSAVGIATCYELDGTGIESRYGARFSTPVQNGLGAHPASYTMCSGSFPWVRRPGRGVDHPPPFNSEVKERVQLYLYSPSGAPWPVLWWLWPLPFHPFPAM